MVSCDCCDKAAVYRLEWYREWKDAKPSGFLLTCESCQVFWTGWLKWALVLYRSYYLKPKKKE